MSFVDVLEVGVIEYELLLHTLQKGFYVAEPVGCGTVFMVKIVLCCRSIIPRRMGC